MKKLVFLVLLFVTSLSFGQAIDSSKWIKNDGSFNYNNWKVRNNLIIPTKTDTSNKISGLTQIIGTDLYFVATDHRWKTYISDTLPLHVQLVNQLAAIQANASSITGKQSQLNGTGFVKSSGTSISYDNTSYFPATGGVLSGTAGNGYVGFTPQSTTPTVPASGFKLFASSAGAFSWLTTQGYMRELRIRNQNQDFIGYFQNKPSYTLGDSADIAAKADKATTIKINGVTKDLTGNQDWGSYLTSESDPKRLSTIAVTGTTTKTVTATLADASTVSTTFTDATGGSTSIDTTNLHYQDSLNYITTLQNSLPIWKRKATAITPVAGDNFNVYEPTVLRDNNPQILTGADTVFKMWYTSGYGSVATAYAESLDGISWTKYSGNPVVSSLCRNSVIKNGSTYVMYGAPTALGLQINRYTSTNGVSWTLANSAIISKGSAGTWNATGVHNSHVIIENGTWEMLLEGGNLTNGYSLGLYTSPDGITWTPYASNPVIAPMASGPCLIKKGGTYYLYTQGTGKSGNSEVLPTDGYKYSSTDLINWSTAGSFFSRGTADEGAGADSGQVADFYVVPVKNSTYLYYSASSNGSNQAGQMRIKVAVANLPIDTLVTMQESNSIFPNGANSYIQFNNYNGFGSTSKLAWDNTNNKLLLGQRSISTSSQIYARALSGSDGLVFATGNGSKLSYINNDGQFQPVSIQTTGTIKVVANNIDAAGYTMTRASSSALARLGFITGGTNDFFLGQRGNLNNTDLSLTNGTTTGLMYFYKTSGNIKISNFMDAPERSSAILDVESNSKGFLPPRMTTTQRNAMAVNANTLTNFNITSTGAGYTTAPTVSFSGGTGTGATATVGITTGSVNPSTLTFTGGSGYTVGDVVTVTFSGGGATTQATAAVTVGQVGMMIYNTTTDAVDVYTKTGWKTLIPQ